MRSPLLGVIALAALVLTSGCAQGGGRNPAPSAPAAVSAAERLVQDQVDAYNRGDIDAFASYYADDIRIYNHPDQLQLSGIEDLRRRYASLFASAPDLHVAITGRIVQGSFVIDQEHVTGVPDRAPLDAVAIYQVVDGRIQNVWFIR